MTDLKVAQRAHLLLFCEAQLAKDSNETNNLLTDSVNQFKTVESWIEGSHSKEKTRRTILGVSHDLTNIT